MAAKDRPKREGVMLAYPTEPGRVSRLGSDFLAQPKLKGLRARIEWFHGEPIILSSYGNQFPFLTQVRDQLIEIRDNHCEGIGLPWDGEVYVHGWSQERLNGATKRTTNPHPDCARLEFHIFDIQHPILAQIKRSVYLSGMEKMITTDHIKPVPTHPANQDNWMEMAQQFIDEGYEGIILRKLDAPYVAKRRVTMLKFKPTEQDEYEIIGFKEGEGWAEGMLGAFQVKGKEGGSFWVGTGPALTKNMRQKLWDVRMTLLNHNLIVKHEPIRTSKMGIPICTVAVKVKGLNL